jgi:hypothetical protein
MHVCEEVSAYISDISVARTKLKRKDVLLIILIIMVDDMAQSWRNEFLTWNPSDFGNITSTTIPADAAWIPDLLITNRYFVQVLAAHQ